MLGWRPSIIGQRSSDQACGLIASLPCMWSFCGRDNVVFANAVLLLIRYHRRAA
jgi:hypothetical protein